MGDDSPSPIRVVIADDHPIFRDGLRRLLEAEPGIEVVGEAGNGEEALARVEEQRPDLLLLDFSMPRMSGLGVLQEISERGLQVRTILLTASIDRDDAVRVLQLGAYGVILKDSATQMLYKCVRAVMAGQHWVAQDHVSDLIRSMQEPKAPPNGRHAPAATLTKRELQIVRAIVDGATNKDVGQRFGLSEQTVKNHMSHIFDKVGVSNRLELALYALHHRLIDRSASDERASS
jgi:two-component system, NarL family, nitrate/nitrite response regulator NarL